MRAFVCVCIHVYEHVQCSTYSFVVHFQFRIAVSLLAVFELKLVCSNGFLNWSHLCGQRRMASEER